jgi:aminoacrylate hydrolase
VPVVKVPGGRIAYDEAGEGDAVVLVSGLGGTGGFWSAQVAAFDPRFRVVTFDHRGVTRSEGAPPYSVGQWSRDVLALLDHAHIERVHLVGHSTGGIIAQAFAAAHPERLLSLVLGGTWLQPDRRFRDQFALRKEVLARLGGRSYRILSDLLASPASDQATQDASRNEMSAHECGIVAARIDALLAYDGAEIASRIAARTLVLAADDDYIVPAHHADAVSAAVAGARLVHFTSGGHFFPRTRAHAYNAALAAFWAEA